MKYFLFVCFTPESGKNNFKQSLLSSLCLNILKHSNWHLPHKKTDCMPSTEKVVYVFSVLPNPSVLTHHNQHGDLLPFLWWKQVSFYLVAFKSADALAWTAPPSVSYNWCCSSLGSQLSVTFLRRLLWPTSLSAFTALTLLEWSCLWAYILIFHLLS